MHRGLSNRMVLLTTPPPLFKITKSVTQEPGLAPRDGVLYESPQLRVPLIFGFVKQCLSVRKPIFIEFKNRPPNKYLGTCIKLYIHIMNIYSLLNNSDCHHCSISSSPR